MGDHCPQVSLNQFLTSATSSAHKCTLLGPFMFCFARAPAALVFLDHVSVSCRVSELWATPPPGGPARSNWLQQIFNERQPHLELDMFNIVQSRSGRWEQCSYRKTLNCVVNQQLWLELNVLCSPSSLLFSIKSSELPGSSVCSTHIVMFCWDIMYLDQVTSPHTLPLSVVSWCFLCCHSADVCEVPLHDDTCFICVCVCVELKHKYNPVYIHPDRMSNFPWGTL